MYKVTGSRIAEIPAGMLKAVSIETMAVVGELARKAPPYIGRLALLISSLMIAGRMTRKLRISRQYREAQSTWTLTCRRKKGVAA